MSLSRPVEIACPQCQNTQHMQLWSTVNVTVDPHLKEEIMQQRLNVFVCSQCTYSGFVDATLLYHDMHGRYCAQYVAKNDMKSPEFYSNLRKDGTVILDPVSAQALGATHGDYLTHPHHVFSMNDLILYIAFRDLCAAWGKES